MDVFLVMYDNGEAWEDGFSYATKAFSSYEKAVQYIEKSLGFVKDANDEAWRVDPQKLFCPAGNDNYYDCPQEGCPLFKQDDNEDVVCCVHEDVFFREENEFYTIRKMPVDEEE